MYATSEGKIRDDAVRYAPYAIAAVASTDDSNSANDIKSIAKKKIIPVHAFVNERL